MRSRVGWLRSPTSAGWRRITRSSSGCDAAQAMPPSTQSPIDANAMSRPSTALSQRILQNMTTSGRPATRRRSRRIRSTSSTRSRQKLSSAPPPLRRERRYASMARDSSSVERCVAGGLPGASGHLELRSGRFGCHHDAVADEALLVGPEGKLALHCERAHDALGEERPIQHEDTLRVGARQDRAQPAGDHDAAHQEGSVGGDDLGDVGERAAREEPGHRHANEPPERKALVDVGLALGDRRQTCHPFASDPDAGPDVDHVVERDAVESRRADGPRGVFATGVAGHRRRGVDRHDVADRQATAAVGEHRRARRAGAPRVRGPSRSRGGSTIPASS